MSNQASPASAQAFEVPAGLYLSAAFAAGLIYPLGFEPFGWTILALFSVGVLCALFQVANSRSIFLIGYLFGLGKYGLGVSWIYVSIHEYGGASPGLAALLVVVFVAGFSLIPAFLGYVYSRAFRPMAPILSMLAFSALWVLHEWVLMWVLTGFPWLLLGYAGLDTSFEGLAPVGGVLLVSFTMAFLASGFAFAIMAGELSKRATYIFVAGVPWVLGWLLTLDEWTQPYGQVTVAVAQGSVPQDLKWQPEHLDLSLDTYWELMEEAWDNDLIVLPEAAIPLTIDRAEEYLERIREQAMATDTGVILGIPKLVPSRFREGWAFHNTALGLGLAEGEYAKQRLVPFGEYVPLEASLRGLIGFFDLPMSHTEPGASDQSPIILHKGDERIEIATAICYEIAFPELVRSLAQDPGFIVTLSNDAWFGNSLGPKQHLQIARMRSVEFGRYVLRATNNGVTAIIAPRKPENSDASYWVVHRNEKDVLEFRVELMRGKTPYHRWGNAWLILSLGLMACFLAIWKRARTK